MHFLVPWICLPLLQWGMPLSEGVLHESTVIEQTAGVNMQTEPDILMAEGMYVIKLNGTLGRPLLMTHHWMSPSEKRICQGEQETSATCTSLKRITQAGQKMAEDMERVFLEHDSLKTRKRYKRGLINLVGKVHKVLFGVATSEDLDQTIEVLNRLGHRLDDAFKAHSDLLEVVNQNAMELQRFANTTNDALRTFHLSLASMFNELSKVRSETNERLVLVEAFTAMLEKINQCRLSLEQTRAVFLSCKENKLSALLFPPHMLRKVLEANQYVVGKKDMTYTIRDSNFETFYEIPTAKCSLETNRTLLVNFEIPLSSSFIPWKAFSISPNRFLNEGLTCSIIEEKMIMASDNSRIVPLNHARQLGDTNIYVRRRFFSPSDNNRCTDTLLKSTEMKEIAEACPLHCKDSKLVTVEPFNATFFTVLNPQDSLHVFCGRSITKTIDPIKNGRYLISLGCECSLQNVVTKETILSDNVVCGGEEAYNTLVDASLTNESFMAHHIYNDAAPETENEAFKLPNLTLADIVVVTAAPVPTGNMYVDLPKTSRDFFIFTWGGTLTLMLLGGGVIAFFLARAGLLPSVAGLCSFKRKKERRHEESEEEESHTEDEGVGKLPGVPLSQLQRSF